MKHTAGCLEHQARIAQAQTEYDLRYPMHCKACGGWGGHSSSYDPSPAGVSLGSGTMEDFDTCSTCLENDKCPRCSATVLGDERRACSGCWWDAGQPGRPQDDPDCGCWYADEPEFHARHFDWEKETHMSFSARTDVDPAGLPVEETPVEDNAPTPFVGLQVWDIARLCHEANRAYCQAIGDDSQPPWSEAPEWQKTSAFDGVLFHLKNPNAGPAASHDNWSKTKIAEGWTYGPVKNPDLKEHPCLVPFTRLPREQQAKDSLFQGIVHALAPFVADEQDIFNVPT